MTLSEGDPSFLSVFVNFDNTLVQFNIRRSICFGGLRRSFCRYQNVDQSTIRFLLNGERIEDSATANSLGLEINDVIESFKEIKGGGWPGKKGLSEDEVKKLLNIIDEELDDDLNSSTSSRMDEEPIQPTNGNEISEIQNKEEEKNEYEETQTNYQTRITIPMESQKDEQDESETLDWIVILRKDYEDGKLTKLNPLDKKIIFYLELPKLEMVEKNILKNLVDMKGKHEEWQSEKLQLDFELDKLESKEVVKRKRKKKGQKVPRNLRSKSKEYCILDNEHALGSGKPLVIKPANEANRKLVTFELEDQENLNRERDDIDLEYSQEDAYAKSLTFKSSQNVGIEPLVKQSPSKQELKIQNKLLLKQLEVYKKKNRRNPMKSEQIEDQVLTIKKPTFIRCNIQNCDKEFSTTVGLLKHQGKIHGEENVNKTFKHICSLCGRNVVYIEQHIRFFHKDITSKEVCEVCQETIVGDMKKHRGSCISCPKCGYNNSKKKRLLEHIKRCNYEKEDNCIQIEPLDLTSPKKVPDKNLNNKSVRIAQDCHEQSIQFETEPRNENIGTVMDKEADLIQMEADQFVAPLADEKASDIDLNTSIALSMKRSKYPFDEIDGEEGYISELEDDDEVEFTKRRRFVKDELELKLREVDNLENLEKEGDEKIIEEFRLFMQNKKSGANKSGEFSRIKEVSTVTTYTNTLKNDILKAFHRLFKPFDSRWIFDCTTPKDCTFEGEKRCFVSPEEPTYMSSKILEEALKRYDPTIKENGQLRANILCTAREFMDFIELQYNNKLNVYGPEPLKKVMTYHSIVRTYVKATGAWKICNDGKKKALHNNKTIDAYQNPNKDIEILEKYHKYIQSEERFCSLSKIINFSSEMAQKPSDGEMTELGKTIMGEIIATTGCRPIVVRHLNNGAYTDKKAGFNPRKVTPDDSVVEEDNGNEKIFRRVNPNLPPKHLACEHQLAQKTAECPVLCDKRVDPDGFNVFVDWDKTSATNGPSYLHITKPLKVLMDLYCIIKSRFFGERKLTTLSSEDWLIEDETPFFLNSAGSEFKFLNLKHLSASMGVDVTAYSYRRIVSTWAMSHESEDIRSAEVEALQHSLKVATDHYLQNKMRKPQTLTQTYIEEERIFPKHIVDEIQKSEERSQSIISENESKRIKRRYDNLIQEKERNKELKSKMKPLGPRHRILGGDRDEIKDLIEKVIGDTVENKMSKMKPLKWRRFMVRMVCTTEGLIGESLRRLWVRVYQGDLMWGVRDIRLRAKEKQWPRKDISVNQNQDRNSWVAMALRKSLSSKITKEIIKN